MNDNFIKENMGAPANKRWHQLMAESELRIRYSLRRRRFVLEIHSLDIIDVQQQENLAQSSASIDVSNSQFEQQQAPIQSSKFSFDLEYDLCLQPQQSS